MTAGSARRLVVAGLASLLLVGCGVDTQSRPDRIPAGGLPSDLRPPAATTGP
jgi:outer membrane biogenesis lipoprotein LolB